LSSVWHIQSQPQQQQQQQKQQQQLHNRIGVLSADTLLGAVSACFNQATCRSGWASVCMQIHHPAPSPAGPTAGRKFCSASVSCAAYTPEVHCSGCYLFLQAGDNTVVLLARDTPPNHPSTRDLGVDMSQVRRST
jgi:hypothetical protein